MNIKRFILAAFCCTALLAGCKKDDETTDFKYFNGIVDLSDVIPAYVAPGDEFVVVREEVVNLSKEDGDDSTDEIGFYVTNPFTSTSDTLGLDWSAYKFTIGDTLGTFTFSVKGFLPGYIASGGSAEFTVVDPSFPGKTLTGIEFKDGDPCFTDSRDGRKYWYTAVGNLLWMRRNLAYEGAGVPFKKSEVMSDLFGRFYTQDEALTACPEGWRLPSDEEFEAMTQIFGGNAGSLMRYTEFNGKRMWEHWSSVEVTDESGLGIIPTGFANRSQDSFLFGGLNEYAALWTSSSEGGLGVYRYLYCDKQEVFRGVQSSVDFALAVRCVKENN